MEVVCAAGLVWTLRRREKPFDPTGVEPLVFQPAQYVTISLEQKVQNQTSQYDENRLSYGAKFLLKCEFHLKFFTLFISCLFLQRRVKLPEFTKIRSLVY